MTVSVFWTVDAAGRGPEWAIVCPGPSLDDTRALWDDLPTIAVDGAAAHPALAYDYWAAWDSPRAVHERCIPRAQERRPAVITRWQATGAWEDLLRSDVSIPSHPLDPMVIGQHPRHDPIPAPWRHAKLDRAPSWLLAMRFAILRGGARFIRLIGLDLEGDSYALGLPDDRQRSPADFEGRWIGERRMFESALHLCRAQGVEIVGGPRIATPNKSPNS